MANSVEMVKAPSRRLTGWVNIQVDVANASLDSDLDPTVSQFQVLNNFVTGGPGAISKRGGILNAGSNATDMFASTSNSPIAFYDGLIGANTYRPYYGFESGFNAKFQNASSGVTTFPGGVTTHPVSKLPTIDNLLIVCGVSTSVFSTPLGKPGAAEAFSGVSSSSAYSTGTVTVAVGSTAVTGSGTTWTASMVGAAFYVGNDSGPFQLNVYQVIDVASATSMTISRPYEGDSPGSSKSYFIDYGFPLSPPASSGFSTTVAAGGVNAKVAASYGKRMFLGSIAEYDTASSSYSYRINRIRWSGTIGSTNADETGYANAASTGMLNFSSTGYLDLGAQYGEILAMAPMQNSLCVFQTSGMTNLVGTPLWSSPVGFDATGVFPTVAINGGFAFESTPYGVFFFDKVVGPCLFDGTTVTRIGVNRVAQSMLPFNIVAVGYYNGKVLFSGSAQAGIFVYDVELDSWSFHTPPAPVYPIIAGRVENGESVVGVCRKRIVNLQNMFDNPGAQTADYDGTSIVANLQTGYIGEPTNLIRPERMYLTYRCSDVNASSPYLSSTIRTGFQTVPTAGFDVSLFDVGVFDDADDTQRTFTSASTDFSSSSLTVTKEVEIVNIQRDVMMSVALTTSGTPGRVDVMAVEVDAVFEGWNGSGT